MIISVALGRHGVLQDALTVITGRGRPENALNDWEKHQVIDTEQWSSSPSKNLKFPEAWAIGDKAPGKESNRDLEGNPKFYCSNQE